MVCFRRDVGHNMRWKAIAPIIMVLYRPSPYYIQALCIILFGWLIRMVFLECTTHLTYIFVFYFNIKVQQMILCIAHFQCDSTLTPIRYTVLVYRCNLQKRKHKCKRRNVHGNDVKIEWIFITSQFIADEDSRNDGEPSWLRHTGSHSHSCTKHTIIEGADDAERLSTSNTGSAIIAINVFRIKGLLYYYYTYIILYCIHIIYTCTYHYYRYYYWIAGTKWCGFNDVYIIWRQSLEQRSRRYACKFFISLVGSL